jgi:hypothetical protein
MTRKINVSKVTPPFSAIIQMTEIQAQQMAFGTMMSIQ